MAKRKVLEAVKFLKDCLDESGLRDSKVILFGSHAKGKARKDSDIDILILSKDFRRQDIVQRALLTKDAELRTIKKYRVPLDILTMTPDEFKSGDSLIAMTVRDGNAIYIT